MADERPRRPAAVLAVLVLLLGSGRCLTWERSSTSDCNRGARLQQLSSPQQQQPGVEARRRDGGSSLRSPRPLLVRGGGSGSSASDDATSADVGSEATDDGSGEEEQEQEEQQHERRQRQLGAVSQETPSVAKALTKLAELLKDKLAGVLSMLGGAPKTLGGGKGFAARFKARYGGSPPAFFEGSFKEATDAALRSHKFCLVFLASEKGGSKGKADDTIAKALADPEASRVAGDRFVVFAAAGGSPSGADAARRVGAKSLPFLGVVRTVAASGKRTVVGLHHCSPAPSARALRGWMEAMVEVHAPLLEADRAELARQRAEKRLPLERKQGYTAAIAADREERLKEKREAAAKAKEEAERKAAEEAAAEKARADAERRAAKAEVLGAEPAAAAAAGGASASAGGGDGAAVVEVMLRLPDGRRERRRFRAGDAAARLWDWADVLGVELPEVRLTRAGARGGGSGAGGTPMDEHADGAKTFSEAGLAGRVLVLVEARDSGVAAAGGGRPRKGGGAAAPAGADAAAAGAKEGES